MKIYKKLFLPILALPFSLFAGNGYTQPISQPIAVESGNINSNDIYLSLAYSYYKHKNSTFNEKLSSNSLTLGFGYSFSEYIALELRYTKSDNIDYKSSKRSKELNSKFSNLSLFTKLSYHVSNLKPYIMLGYGRSKITNLAKSDRVENSLEYGAGLEYKLNKNFSIFADYTTLYNKKGFDGRATKDKQKITLITTGLIYKF